MRRNNSMLRKPENVAKKSRGHSGLGMSLGMLFAAAPGKAAAVSSYGFEA
jgi:hypothetical protein